MLSQEDEKRVDAEHQQKAFACSKLMFNEDSESTKTLHDMKERPRKSTFQKRHTSKLEPKHGNMLHSARVMNNSDAQTEQTPAQSNELVARKAMHTPKR